MLCAHTHILMTTSPLLSGRHLGLATIVPHLNHGSSLFTGLPAALSPAMWQSEGLLIPKLAQTLLSSQVSHGSTSLRVNANILTMAH